MASWPFLGREAQVTGFSLGVSMTRSASSASSSPSLSLKDVSDEVRP